VLFGSDYPLITPDRWITDFETLGIEIDIARGILKLNAARLLGIEMG
jgi:hypothetical protein